MMSFGVLKQFFVRTFWFKEKQTPETYTVEFDETKEATFVK